jgi:hypothetical protein
MWSIAQANATFSHVIIRSAPTRVSKTITNNPLHNPQSMFQVSIHLDKIM